MVRLKACLPHLWITGYTVVLAVLENTRNDVLNPEFDTSERNVTVIAGDTAVLPCFVNLEEFKQYQIVWMNPKNILISKVDRRLNDDDRMSVERPFVEDWNLHIRNVRYDDRGTYKCTLNTDPVGIKAINLIVKVAPDIIESWSSGNQVVLESSTVRLHCNATGVPTPTITWYRKTAFTPVGKKEEIGRSGEILLIHNISRYCDGIYECVADNGVADKASKEIIVDVNFPPETTLRTKRISQSVGKETMLNCLVAASPQAQIYWKKGNTKITTKYGKYRSEIYDEGPHTVTLSLQIVDLKLEDFGNYTCEASNKLGRDSETMLLIEYIDPSKLATPRTEPIRDSWVREHITSPVTKYNNDRDREMYGTVHIQSGPIEMGQFNNESDHIRSSKFHTFLVILAYITFKSLL